MALRQSRTKNGDQTMTCSTCLNLKWHLLERKKALSKRMNEEGVSFPHTEEFGIMLREVDLTLEVLTEDD